MPKKKAGKSKPKSKPTRSRPAAAAPSPAPAAAGFDPTAKHEIEYVDPATLVPAPWNPRGITPEARKRLKEGIAMFGLVEPVVARREDRLIVGGHQRRELAVVEKWAKVPVVFVEGLGDAQARALAVLLNNPEAQGRFETRMLASLLLEVRKAGMDATVTGYDEEQVAALLKKLKPEAPAEFPAIPGQLAVTITCPKCGYGWTGKSGVAAPASTATS